MRFLSEVECRNIFHDLLDYVSYGKPIQLSCQIVLLPNSYWDRKHTWQLNRICFQNVNIYMNVKITFNETSGVCFRKVSLLNKTSNLEEKGSTVWNVSMYVN